MKKIFILLLLGILCGCAANKALKERSVEEKTNLFNAYENKENVEGYTQREILRKFGEPDLTEESSVYDNTVTVWHYKDIYYNLKVTFVNEIVTEIEYH